MLKVRKILFPVIIFLLAGTGGFLWQTNLLRRSESTGQNAAQTTPAPKTAPDYPKTLGDFLVTDKKICEEEGKPIVYFFGSSSCPHCVWEKPIAKEVFEQFKDEISYHENFDNSNDSDVFTKYSDINPGYVPFLILGCKYARVGAGEQLGITDEESKKLEKEAMTAIVCKLTDGKPKDVCNQIKDRVKEVK